MNAKIEKLKQRATLWRQKADQLLAATEAKAELQADSLMAKADALLANQETRSAERAQKWEHNPEKVGEIVAKGEETGAEIHKRWVGRARTLLLKAKQAAELQAGLWRTKASALESEAMVEEERVKKAQQDAFNEETRNNR